MSMETVHNYPLARKVKADDSNSSFERKIRKFLPHLEEFIVRKTQSDKRRALFGKDPFYG
jgi:hypothetical protein